MIKLILGNSVINIISSRLLAGNSKLIKPAFVLFLISLSLFILGIQQIFRIFNPRRYLFIKKDRITQFKTA
jgi:hypothetical protein